MQLVPMRARKMRLERAARKDAEWLARTLGHASSEFGTRIDTDGALMLRIA